MEKTIGYADENLLKFAKQADLSGDVLGQYKIYMQSASKATSAFAATLKSVAANIGIMLAINVGIQLITYAFTYASKKAVFIVNQNKNHT